MEEKAKMNWNFFRFKIKEKSSKAKETEQPLRHVYANARAGDKVSFKYSGDFK